MGIRVLTVLASAAALIVWLEPPRVELRAQDIAMAPARETLVGTSSVQALTSKTFAPSGGAGGVGTIIAYTCSSGSSR